MSIDEFARRVKDPERTKDELNTMRKNALAKAKPEFAEIVEEELDRRFPAWDKPKTMSGPTPTTAIFGSTEKKFTNGKDAYLWLIEMFRSVKPDLLESQSKWHEKAFKGAKRFNFARRPSDLFPDRSDLARSRGNFGLLADGWFANANINHAQKFDILLRLGVICGLSYPNDWDFRVTGASQGLEEKQKFSILVAELTKELEKELKEL